jgi:hypothetical protein
MEQLGSYRTDFHEIWYLKIFSKNWREDSIFTKIWQEEEVVDTKTYVNLWYLAELFLEWEMFPTKVVKKTHLRFSNILPEVVPFMRQRGKVWYIKSGRSHMTV